MSAQYRNRPSALIHLLVLGEDGLPRCIEVIDGDSTGLAAIAGAIIKQGFPGVRAARQKQGALFDVQFNLATPEGRCIAYLRDRAIQGSPLPSVEKVMEILLPLRRGVGGRQP